MSLPFFRDRAVHLGTMDVSLFLCEDMDIEREVLSRIHDFNPEQVSVNWVFLESDCLELGPYYHTSTLPNTFSWQDSLDNFERDLKRFKTSQHFVLGSHQRAYSQPPAGPLKGGRSMDKYRSTRRAGEPFEGSLGELFFACWWFIQSPVLQGVFFF